MRKNNLINITPRLVYWIILVIILLLLPRFIPRYYLILTGNIVILGLFALSFNLLFGYTGLLSFGQAGFFAAGAYTTSLILIRITPTGYVIYIAILAAILVSAVASAIIGSICVRLSGWVFGMVTMAFGQVIYTILFKWIDFTGGDNGLTGVAFGTLSLFGFNIDLSSLTSCYYFVVVIVMVSILILRMITNSPFGHALQAIRNNPLRAEFLGLNIRNYKLASFIIAGTFSGLAGALFSPFKGLANPELAAWFSSADPVMMTLIGGSGVFLGPLVGAVIYELVRHFVIGYFQYWMLVFGIIVLLCVIFFPRGVTPYLIEIGQKLHAVIITKRTKKSSS